ncbi:MAG: acyltransferase [Rhodospirillales bacterium]
MRHPMGGSPAKSAVQHRLAFLDSLRGLAALYVVLYHLTVIPDPDLKLPRWASSWVLYGGSGVTLFFVISAFSLSLTMPNHIASGRPLISFYVHRFFRIAPLFYALIIFSVLRDFYSFGVLRSWTEILASVLFYANFVPRYANIFVSAGWTIGVEMPFYAIFPLFYFRCTSLTQKITACLLFVFVYSCFIALAPYVVREKYLEAYVGYLTIFKYLPTFIMGMCAYDLWASRKVQNGGRDLGLLLVAVFFVMFAGLLGGRVGGFFDPFYWQSLTFVCLVVGLSLAPIGIMVNRATRFLGKISYSLYLIHFPVIYHIVPYQRIYDLPIGTSLKFLTSVAVTCAIVIPLSYLTFRLIENPGIWLGRKVLAKWIGPPAGRGAVAGAIPNVKRAA